MEGRAVGGGRCALTGWLWGTRHRGHSMGDPLVQEFPNAGILGDRVIEEPEYRGPLPISPRPSGTIGLESLHAGFP